MDQLIHDLKSEEFLLTDRSFLVNIRHVSQIRGNIMHLTGDHQIPVSRARLEEVKKCPFRVRYLKKCIGKNTIKMEHPFLQHLLLRQLRY